MYGKVFSQLFHGSMIGQRDVQHVFIFLICHADKSGTVEAHPREISSLTGIPEAEVSQALDVLCSPDPYSRSPEQDGRRLERTSDGFTWQIVNYKAYLAMQDRDTVRSQTRERVRRYRERHNPPSIAGSVTVTPGNGSKRQGEGEGEVSVPSNGGGMASPSGESCKPSSPASGDAARTNGAHKKPSEAERHDAFFRYFWPAYPRKVNRQAALEEFCRLCLSESILTDMLDGLEWHKKHEWSIPDRIIPHARTWLHQKRWMDAKPARTPDR